MINSVIADIVGSTYEGGDKKGMDLPLLPEGSTFTDDTVLMVATAYRLMAADAAGRTLDSLTQEDFARAYRVWGRDFPRAGFSPQFKAWFEGDSLDPIYSLGSGVTSRVFPIAWMADSEEQLLSLADASSRATHDSNEAANASCAVAYACYQLLHGASAETVSQAMETRFFLPMNPNWDDLHSDKSFSTNAEEVAGVAIAIGLSASSHREALNLVLYCGGDTDTIGAVAMAIMDARYPGHRMPDLERTCRNLLREEFLGDRLESFMNRFDREFLGLSVGNDCPDASD